MKNNEVRNSLIILVWNEIEAIRKLYDRIPFVAADESIVIDGGSTDGTVEFLRSKGLPVYTQIKRGRGNAFLEGLKHSKGENLVFFSGDGNEDPADIPKMFRYLNSNYDMVIAGRFIFRNSKSDDSDDSLKIRKFFNIALSLAVRILWNIRVRDAINGFRGMKRTAMEKMRLDAPKHEIEFQTTIRAGKLGLNLKEFPTKELVRLGGLRKSTAGTTVLAFNFFRFFLKEFFRGKDFAK